jgi:hypothetical protein
VFTEHGGKAKPTLKSAALVPVIAETFVIVTTEEVPLLIVAVIEGVKPPTGIDGKTTGFGEITVAVVVPVPLRFTLIGLPEGPV